MYCTVTLISVYNGPDTTAMEVKTYDTDLLHTVIVLQPSLGHPIWYACWTRVNIVYIFFLAAWRWRCNLLYLRKYSTHSPTQTYQYVRWTGKTHHIAKIWILHILVCIYSGHVPELNVNISGSRKVITKILKA